MTNTKPAHTYFKGDKGEYTGDVVVVPGKTFYVIRMVEGHLAGQIKLVTNAPK